MYITPLDLYAVLGEVIFEESDALARLSPSEELEVRRQLLACYASLVRVLEKRGRVLANEGDDEGELLPTTVPASPASDVTDYDMD